MTELVHGELTEKILGVAFEVHRSLGPGFLESVYEEAMAVELGQCQIPFKRQVDVPVHYKSVLVGGHRLDLIVSGLVVVELKAVRELADIHTAIALSYLKATKLSVALLLNFATPSLEYKRVSLKGPQRTSA
ncbi:MAG TPA: GxxExxY protein [Symbiobacteriaceae bacterium]|nr:GxxExxY protein [Symbiobacteriaceae bacterium]